jgi:hypothetical protein
MLASIVVVDDDDAKIVSDNDEMVLMEHGNDSVLKHFY